jgi:hypothetical protein
LKPAKKLRDGKNGGINRVSDAKRTIPDKTENGNIPVPDHIGAGGVLQ